MSGAAGGSSELDSGHWLHGVFEGADVTIRRAVEGVSPVLASRVSSATSPDLTPQPRSLPFQTAHGFPFLRVMDELAYASARGATRPGLP